MENKDWFYDEISPITGNKSVIREGDLRICFESGYHTYDSWEIGSEEQINFASKSPENIVKSQKVINGQVWYLISLFSENHVLLPDEDGSGRIVNSWRDLEPESEIKYELTREMSNGTQKYIQVLDPNTEKHFIEFEDAYNEFHKRKNLD